MIFPTDKFECLKYKANKFASFCQCNQTFKGNRDVSSIEFNLFQRE